MTARSMTSWKSAPATGEVSGGRDAHCREAETHTREHALACDEQSPPADVNGVRDAIDAIDCDHGVGRLGRDRRTRGAHRDAEVGEGKGGGIVYAVADHHDRLQSRRAAQAPDHLELVLR